MRRGIVMLAALAALVWMSGCSDKDPVSSQNEGADSPAGKLVTSKTKAGGRCELPPCKGSAYWGDGISTPPPQGPPPAAANKAIVFENQPVGENGNYVRVPNSSSLAINGPEVTLEAWVLFAGDNGQIFLGETQSGSNDYLILNSAQSGAGSWVTMVNEAPVSAGASPTVGGVWQHVALTYSAQARRFYVNGSLTSESAGGRPISATNDIFFSGRATSSAYLNGQLDDIRIWNRALTPAEIQANMNKRLTGSENGLIGYWTFDRLDASGHVPDISGHGNDGIIMGNAQLVNSTAPIH